MRAGRRNTLRYCAQRVLTDNDHTLARESYMSFLEVFDTTNKILLVSGIAFLALGIFAPKKFFGIIVDWTPATSGVALVFGMILFGLSFWLTPAPQTVTPTQLDAVIRNVQKGRDNAAGAASNTSDNRGCVDAAKTAVQQLDEALRLLADLKSKPAKS